MKNKPRISKIIDATDKQSQSHGNYCIHAELDNGDKMYYHRVSYQIPSLHITYKNGKTRTFKEEFNSLPEKRNFGNTKYSEVVKQIRSYFGISN